MDNNLCPYWVKINDMVVDFYIRLDEGSDSCVEIYAASFEYAREWGMLDLIASVDVSTIAEALNVIARWKQRLQSVEGVDDLL